MTSPMTEQGEKSADLTPSSNASAAQAGLPKPQEAVKLYRQYQEKFGKSVPGWVDFDPSIGPRQSFDMVKKAIETNTPIPGPKLACMPDEE